MDIINKSDLENLSTEQDGWHVSIFMPTHRAGVEIQQDPIRLKNLLRQASEQLEAVGLRPPEAGALLEPVRQLVEDGLFWQHQSDGLAIFVSSEESYLYRLPLDLEELVVVGQRFHVKPLLTLLSGDGRFYVLALSQDKVRLLQGTRYRVAEMDLSEAPSSLAEALHLDDPERRLQFHTASGPSGGRGRRPAVFYGSGAPSQDEKGRILRYFQKLDVGLCELLAGEQAPLVLAGVDYLLPLYREANDYPHLVETGIEGNPENLSAEELHQQAWAIVRPRFLAEREEAVRRFRHLAATDKATAELDQIVPAAHYGQIETLFVARGLQRWGTFDPAINEIDVVQDAGLGAQDLLDLAAVQALRQGGNVYALEPEQMPADAPLAAILRY